MPKPKIVDRSEGEKRKLAFNKERRGQFAADAPVAMAEYRKAADDTLTRMARLRAERLERAENH